MSNQSQPTTSTESLNSSLVPISQTTAISEASPSNSMSILTDGLPTWFVGEGVQGLVTTIDLSTEDGRLSALDCKHAQGVPLMDRINLEFDLVNVLAFPVRIQKPEGEILDAVRLHLITAKGEVLTTCSPSVRSVLIGYMAAYKMKSFDPPLKLVAVKRKGTGPHAYLSLERVQVPAVVNGNGQKPKK